MVDRSWSTKDFETLIDPKRSQEPLIERAGHEDTPRGAIYPLQVERLIERKG